MTAITLDQADRLIDAILKRGAELDCRPLSVIVVEPGCKVKAFKKEDGSSMIRFEMAYGKTYAALAMGRSSKLVKVRAEEKPIFMRYLLSATGDQIFPEGGGVQIRDADGEVIGAVGVTGDTEDRDEELAAYGVRAIGLKTDEDCTGSRPPRRRPPDQHVTGVKSSACHAGLTGSILFAKKMMPGQARHDDQRARITGTGIGSVALGG